MSGFVGAVLEAWDELRIHKVRVLLSLIGVAVAVTAITGVTAAVAMLKQGFAEQADRYNGRPVTLMVNAYSSTGPATSAAQTATYDAAYQQALARYSITWASRTQQTMAPFRFPQGTQTVPINAVDPAYGAIYRTRVIEGRWFTPEDEKAFAPVLVVNQAFLTQLGVADLRSHPTVQLGDAVTATIIGVQPEQWSGESPTAFVLYDQLTHWYQVDPTMGQALPTLAMWVPTDQVDGLSSHLVRDMKAAVPGLQVDVQDNRTWGGGELDSATKWIGLGVGGFALLLGGLGLVNISLTTVRYRIREIGIRRSFGATSGRVFFGVMMESVVATVVAGLAGVVLAVVLLKNLPIDRVFGGGLQDIPPFPVSAALVGMAAATGVGALAGIIPALVAVRVKVIDAIRY
ncbi:ABC transporter permease [Cellulomonas citrea]|uniref:ABC transporter permease n=1 Tax=Cellulomonas citrea TaxID=1909423 RepID=UPI00135BC9C0|nr:ABC transporter permease [Cellulomonas citrea]